MPGFTLCISINLQKVAVRVAFFNFETRFFATLKIFVKQFGGKFLRNRSCTVFNEQARYIKMTELHSRLKWSDTFCAFYVWIGAMSK